MNRQKPVEFNFSGRLEDVPLPIAVPGSLLSVNSGFRSQKPVLKTDTCRMCMMCYIMCPDGTIYKDGDKLAVDYDYCKGCGICAQECKFDSIEMVPEE